MGKERFRTANWAMGKFLALFVSLVLFFTALLRVSWVDETIIVPYTKFIAALSSAVLGSLGIDASPFGTAIIGKAFAVEIRRGCDGVVATILLVSACIAYPFSWKRRVLGILWGYLLIFGVNLARVVILFIVGLNVSKATFNFTHIYVAQFVVITAAMVFWIFWAGGERAIDR